MTTDTILASIDAEISQLKQARVLLSGGEINNRAIAPTSSKKGTMSAAARKRIGDAQRKRWAKQKATK